MDTSEQLFAAFGILLLIGCILGIFVLALYNLANWIGERNELREIEERRLAEAEAYDKQIMEQAKNHTVTEQTVRDIKDEEFTFDDVKFDINYKNSVVRTEVVYAD